MTDEPLFMAVRDSEPAFQQTIRDAQATLSEFRSLLKHGIGLEYFPCIKTRICAGDESAFIWLLVKNETSGGFRAEVFEIPPEFKEINVGQQVEVLEANVMDWMVNERGRLHGGFSLRYQRSKLPAEKQSWYDGHVGVTEYLDTAVLPPDNHPSSGTVAAKKRPWFQKFFGPSRPS
jgi:uncharacterized protein YegJ (DUF2314 family)